MPKTKASFGMIAVTLCTVTVMFVLPITPKIPVSTAVIERGNLVMAQSLEGRVGYGDQQVCGAPLAGRAAKRRLLRPGRAAHGSPGRRGGGCKARFLLLHTRHYPRRRGWNLSDAVNPTAAARLAQCESPGARLICGKGACIPGGHS